MHVLRAFQRRGVAPRGEGGLGPGKGAVDLFPARLAYLGQHFTGIGGVDRRQQGFRGHILAVDVERQGPALRRAHRSDALRVRLPLFGDGEVHRRLVPERREGPFLIWRRLLLPGGEFSFQRDGGVFHQQLDRRAVREALAQEGFVGGVFQQAAHEIGHAGDQLSVGAIEAHTASHVAQALAYGFGHAVKHLKFIAFFGNVQLPRILHDRRDAAHVVRCAREIDDVVVLEDEAGNFLMGQVAFGLVRPHRDGPVALLREHGFRVPIRPLDQPQGDGQLFFPSPSDEITDSLFRILQIGLLDKAKMRIMAEFRGGTQALEQLYGDFAVFELFHVDTHEPAHIDGFLVEGCQPPVDAFHGILQRYGVRP